MCPLSVAISEQFPALKEDPSGPEGTAAHEVWLMMLNGYTPEIGEMTSERMPVTVEMIDGAQQFVDKIHSIVDPYDAMFRARFEERVTMSGIHRILFGTPDGSINLLEECGEYHLVDYKFGHRSVCPFENWQLALYFYGECERLGLTDEQIDNAKVFFHIVQPRCYTYRSTPMTWETTGSNLRKMWDKARAAAYEAITMELAAYACMGEWCRDCPGRRACPTFRRNAGANIDWSSRAWPSQMSTEDAGIELTYVQAAVEQLKAYQVALEQQVEFDIGQGEHSPHWAIEGRPGKGREWLIPIADIFAIGDSLEVDLRKKQEPITPSQAIDLLKKKGFDRSLIDEYSAPKKGGVALVPKTSTLASRVFGAKNDGMA